MKEMEIKFKAQRKTRSSLLLFAAVGTLLIAFTSSNAFAAPKNPWATEKARERFLTKAKQLVLRCAVQPYAYDSNGNKVFSVLRNECPTEIQLKTNWVRFYLNGKTFYATLIDSEHSDGGDLNHLTYLDSSGNVIVQLFDIPAFGDILLAMAAGEDSFRQVYDATVILQ